MYRHMIANGENFILANVENFHPTDDGDYTFQLIDKFDGHIIKTPDGNAQWTLNRYFKI